MQPKGRQSLVGLKDIRSAVMCRAHKFQHIDFDKQTKKVIRQANANDLFSIIYNMPITRNSIMD